MSPMWLIAGNLLREQRWLLLVLVLWIVGSTLIATAGSPVSSTDDVLFFLKQQAMYGVAFTAFLAASAVQNERKSRRILAVLSKGIERRTYLGGLLVGVFGAAILYCAAMAIAGAFVFPQARIPQPGSWIVIVMLAVTCAFTSTLALLFSTVMAPFIAVIATAITLGMLGAAVWAWPSWSVLFPVFGMLESIVEFGPGRPLSWYQAGPLLLSAVMETVVLWLLASKIFEYRDVAVPVE